MGLVDVVILVYFLAMLAGILFFLVQGSRHWRPLLIVVVLTACGLFIYKPGSYGPSKSLNPGIDLAGGTTLTYDVKVPSGRDAGEVIDDTIAVLQRRVDPTGTRNLIWRRVAGNRIEVQMAMAPRIITLKRQAYLDAQQQLLTGNLDKRQVVAALALDPQDQAAMFDSIAAGNTALRQQLDEMAQTKAALDEVQGPYDAAQQAYDDAIARVDNPPAGTSEADLAESKRIADEMLASLIPLAEQFNAARAAHQSALATVLQSNLSANELDRIRDLDNDPTKAGVDPTTKAPLPTPRALEVDKLVAQNPDRAEQIRTYFNAYAEYEAIKGPLDDPNDLIALLQGSGVLEMRIAATPRERPIDAASYITRLEEQGPRAGTDREWKWYEVQDIEVFVDRDMELLQSFRSNPESFTDWVDSRRGMVGRVYGNRFYLLLADSPQLAMTRDQVWKLASVNRSADQLGKPAVGFSMDGRGAVLLGNLTGPNVGKQMAVMLDNKVITAPTLQARLTDGGIITGDFSNEEFEYLIRTIKAGSLEGQLGEYPISIKTTGPAMGQENLYRGVEAAITALIIVAIFMAVYYLFAGMVANFALAANMVIILGVMAMIDATFTLPGIAGIVLTIGMAVDANVLIFERIREELEAKADLRTAVRLGFDKALSTILDANITTLITCLVLGYTATAEIKGFAVTLGIGILATLFTALFCSRVFIEAYVRYTNAKTLMMMPTLLPPLRQLLSPNVDWLKLSRVFIPLSVLLIAVGMYLVYERGMDMLDIEFRSGTKVSFTLANEDGDATRPRMIARTDAESRIKTYAAIGADLQAGRAPVRPAQVPASIDWDKAVSDMNRVVEDASRRYEEAMQSYQELVDAQASPGDKPDLVSDFNLLARSTLVTEGRVQDGKSNGFAVSTLMTDSQAVSDLIKSAFEDLLDTTQPVSFEGVAVTDPARAPIYRISSTDLSQVVGRPILLPEGLDAAEFLGGVAILLDGMDPAPTLTDLEQRIGRMRQQPAHEDLGYRPNRVVGLEIAYTDATGTPHYRSALVLTTDGVTNYLQTPTAFTDADGLAYTEWRLVRDALQRDTSLASVTKFSSQVSGTMKQQALAAMFLSLLAVVAYIWLRFGSIRYGFAAIAALVHDVCVTMGIVAICGWLFDTGIGHALLLFDFKINLALVAAILTIIGYSLNDTIVVFDRIRENRGRLARASRAVVNESINQTISRTILTSGTTMIAVVLLYLLGGPGVHGFAFAMIIGILVGTYSSIAIAAPVLMIGYKDGTGGSTRQPDPAVSERAIEKQHPSDAAVA